MSYQRYKNPAPLSPEERQALLRSYYLFYEEEIKRSGFERLNQKLPRNAAEELLDEIGRLLVSTSRRLAENPGEVRDFLDANPLPPGLEERLPDKFRVFTLLLNALKQWVGAEANACDRYLLGGRWREYCKEAADHSLLTGEALEEPIELHHPVRDGRPPIPLNKGEHSRIEGQSGSAAEDEESEEWKQLRELKGRNRSWVMLRRGLADIQTGRIPEPGTTDYFGKSFANKVLRELDTTPEHILDLLDENGK